MRDSSPALGRSWQVFHPITPDSPLYGVDAAALQKQDAEIIVSLTGIDGTSSQTVHGRHRYLPEQIRFGMRYADMLNPKPDGRLELDYAKLHEITPASV
jgi:inward rectifier potassium channel